jgi:hypothetical protein
MQYEKAGKKISPEIANCDFFFSSMSFSCWCFSFRSSLGLQGKSFM